jgi:hypothetical protein
MCFEFRKYVIQDNGYKMQISKKVFMNENHKAFVTEFRKTG